MIRLDVGCPVLFRDPNSGLTFDGFITEKTWRWYVVRADFYTRDYHSKEVPGTRRVEVFKLSRWSKETIITYNDKADEDLVVGKKG